MDYENDYNLLEDVAEDQDVWEDLEDEDKENSYPEGFDLIDPFGEKTVIRRTVLTATLCAMAIKSPLC